MKKQFLLLTIPFFIYFNLTAQVAIKPEAECCIEKTVEAFDDAQKELLQEELKQFAIYLEKEMEYPELAQTYHVEGRVVVRVSFDGTIKAFKVTKSLHPECDKLVEEKIRDYIETLDKKKYQDMPLITFQVPVDFSLAGF